MSATLTTLPYSLPASYALPLAGRSTHRAGTNKSAPELPSDPYDRLRTLYPTYVTATFAAHHCDFWAWESAIEPGIRPDPFVGIWARGGAKSTSAELAVVDLGARSKRKYCLYVSGTQEQADDHVGNVAIMLESDALARYVPEMGERRLGKYGNSRGWRRNRLWTAHGFVVDAIGLDTAARGVKLEEQRPDLIVLDDIDDTEDSPATTRKKIDAITKRLLPAGSSDVAVLAIQNLVIPNGVFAQLADGRADWLARRMVSGPIPAVENLTYVTENGRHRITGGTPTWEGQNLATCQAQLEDWGLMAFLTEAQHDVEATGDMLVYGRRDDGIRYYDPERNRKPARWRLEDSKWQVVVVDPGGGGLFKSGLGVIGVSGDERMHWFREGLLSSSISARQVAEWIATHNLGPDAIVYDPSQESLGEGLRELGFNAVPANNSRQYGVGLVREYFVSGRLTIDPESVNLHRQLNEYWVIPMDENIRANGTFPTRAGPGHHAELPDGLRYGVVFIQEAFPRSPGTARPRMNLGTPQRRVGVR